MAGNVARKLAQHLVTASNWIPGANSASSTVAIAAFLGAIGGFAYNPSKPIGAIIYGATQGGISQWVAERSASHFDLEAVARASRSRVALTTSGPSGIPRTVEGRGFIGAGLTGAVIGMGQAMFQGGSGAGFLFKAMRSAMIGFVESTVTTVLAQNIFWLGSSRAKGRATVCGPWIPNGEPWKFEVTECHAPPEAISAHEGYLEAMGTEQHRKFRESVSGARVQLAAFLKAHGFGKIDLEKRVGPIYLSRGGDRGGDFGRSTPADHRIQLNCKSDQQPIDPTQPEMKPFNYCRINYDWGNGETAAMDQWMMVTAMLASAVAKLELEYTGTEVKFRKGIAEYTVRGRELTKAEEAREEHMRRFNLGTFEYLAWEATGKKISLPTEGHKICTRAAALAETIRTNEGSERVQGFQTALMQTAAKGDIDVLGKFLCGEHPASAERLATVRTYLTGGDFLEAYAEAIREDESAPAA